MTRNRIMLIWTLFAGLVLSCAVGRMISDLIRIAIEVVQESGALGLVRDGLFLHKLGEIIIFAALVTCVFIALIQGGQRAFAFLQIARVVMWVGGLLNGAALLLVGDRIEVATWAFILILIAFGSPWIIEKFLDRMQPRRPPPR